MLWLSILYLLIGFAILIFGAELLVRGAASLAKKFGISSMVVGLTVVAFGTSTPELVVNMFSAVKGSADIAIGNVVGSNIANILIILGISALFTPLTVRSNTVWKEIPFALLGVALLYTMGNDILFDGASSNAMTRTDGFSLIAIFIIFMFYTFGISKISYAEPEIKQYSKRASILLTIAGIALLVAGGKVLVDNAILVARYAGLSEALIGLTVVAVGTSLPEMATSIVAAYHKQADIAIGNIVGSNIFNIFWILGLTATILQLPFNAATNFDVLVAIGATIMLFISMFLGKRNVLERWQGVVFLGLYVAYVGYLIYRG